MRALSGQTSSPELGRRAPATAGGHGKRGSAVAGSSKGLQSSASLVLAKGGGGSSSSTSLGPRASTAQGTSREAPHFRAPTMKTGDAYQLKVLRDRFSTGFTACTVNPLFSSGWPAEGRALRPGAYRSKAEMLDSLDPIPRPVEDYTQEEHKAATIIQKVQRSKVARQNLEEAQWAAQLIQSRARGFQARGRVAEGKKKRKKASSKIQKNYFRQRMLQTPEETAQELQTAFAESPGMLRQVALAMEQAAPLSVLNLQHCLLGPEPTERLAQALRKNSTITVLDLGSCYIGDPGAGHLADNLKFSPVLKRLALSWNSIGDEGASKLAEVVPKLELLRDLDLSYNRVSNEGAASLAFALKATPTLASLALQANRISRPGVAELLAACREWVHLNLDGNNYTGASASRSPRRRSERSVSKQSVASRSSRTSAADRGEQTPLSPQSLVAKKKGKGWW